MEPLEITPQVLRTFDIGRVFKDNHADINSMCFSDDCSLLVTSSEDDSVNIYNVLRGTREKLLFNKEHGVDNVKFTHHPNALLCSTKKGSEHMIKYWSTYDNRIIHNFRGHTDAINSLAMSPKSDLFISTGQDKQMIVWDLRNKRCLGRSEYREAVGSGMVAFDPSGSVFALVYPVVTQNTTKNFIKLYDAGNFLEGAFNTWEIPCPEIKGIEFSDDGNKLLAYTVENQILVMDSIDGATKQLIRDFSNDNGKVMATFSACSKYVVTGCEKTNSVLLFESDSGQKVQELKGHPKTPTCLAWSKEHALLVTACQNLLFWVPDLSKRS
jgi:COMPASS component SWD2